MVQLAALVLTAVGALALPPGLTDEELLASLDASVPADKLILDAREAVEQDPGDAVAHVRLGNAYRDAALMQWSLASFEEATALDPLNTVAWNNLGVLQAQLGDAAHALQSFQSAVDVSPRNAEARYNLAHALAGRGDFDGAVDELAMALRIEPRLGNRFDNPRVSKSRIILPTIVNLYRASIGSGTLPVMGATGESGLTRVADTRWLPLTPKERRMQREERERKRTVPKAPEPDQKKPGKPIVIGPESIEGDGDKTQPSSRSIGGQTMRSGGRRPGKR